MQMRPLGSSGITVSSIGLGAMSLSLEGRPTESDAIAVIHAALDAGIRLVDTADVYCLDDKDIGHNERLVAKAVASWAGDADDVVVATKGGLERPNAAWSRDGRPEHIRQACERSLRALGVSAIALYQIHAPDPKVPWADTVGEVARLREEGKIRHVGISNVSLKEIDQARTLVPIVAVQNRMNPYDLTSWLSGVVQGCIERDIAFLAYSPVGGLRQLDSIAGSRPLHEMGRAYDATPFEVALAWLLAKAPNIVPIPGSTRLESVRSSARAAAIVLQAKDVQALDQALGA
jgi:aryl-alcohol dehydrogenase-like predicted oxidoreductase